MFHFENHDRRNYGGSWCNDYRCNTCFRKAAKGKGEQIIEEAQAEVEIKEKISVEKKETINVTATKKVSKGDSIEYENSKKQ